LNFRDPLFHVIAFLVIVLVFIVGYIIFEKVRNYFREKNINKLLKEFDYLEIESLKLDTSSINALYLLANAYEKEGDYEKALKIYLWINKNLNSLDILRNIALLYYKAGFLEKAKNILYQILQTKPRDVKSLKLLILVDEKLGDLKEIVDILEIFETLELEFEKEKAFALFKLFLNGSCNIEFCEGISSIDDVYKNYPFIKREYLEFLFQNNPNIAYELISKEEIYQYLDLYWQRNDIPQDKFCNILAAKKRTSCNEEGPFEIEVLKNLKKDIADLEFEYICENCHNVFPFYTSRCPHCHELFTQKLIINLRRAYL